MVTTRKQRNLFRVAFYLTFLLIVGYFIFVKFPADQRGYVYNLEIRGEVIGIISDRQAHYDLVIQLKEGNQISHYRPLGNDVIFNSVSKGDSLFKIKESMFFTLKKKRNGKELTSCVN